MILQPACKTIPTRIFYDEEHQTEALNICKKCPLQVPCLELALENDLKFGTWGIWAGKTPAERRKLLYQRNGKLPGFFSVKDSY
jgi:WhiB family redox-sensing transcriptional regulator